jgi:hypothetical protein
MQSAFGWTSIDRERLGSIDDRMRTSDLLTMISALGGSDDTADGRGRHPVLRHRPHW